MFVCKCGHAVATPYLSASVSCMTTDVVVLVSLADVDECLLSDVECGNANCVNTNGSYICQCLRGFKRSDESDLQSSCGKLDMHNYFSYML